MLKIDEKWPNYFCGPCNLGGVSEGWLQRQRDPDRICLEVVLAQRQQRALFPYLHRKPLDAKVDTGSPYTVISRSRFERLGFVVPARPATNLHVSGVVRRLKGEVTDEECLWGWRDVPLKASLLSGLWGEQPRLPTCTLKVMVAENVDSEKFLVGLDFLRHFQCLFTKNLFVAMAD